LDLKRFPISYLVVFLRPQALKSKLFELLSETLWAAVTFSQEARGVFVRRHGMELLAKLLKCEDAAIRVPALRCIARLTEFAPYCDVFVSCRGVNALALIPVDSRDKEVCVVALQVRSCIRRVSSCRLFAPAVVHAVCVVE
jgi:hypothetical protein